MRRESFTWGKHDVRDSDFVLHFPQEYPSKLLKRPCGLQQQKKWNKENLERERSEPRAAAGEKVKLCKLMVKRRRDSALVPRGFTARPSRVRSIYYDSKET